MTPLFAALLLAPIAAAVRGHWAVFCASAAQLTCALLPALAAEVPAPGTVVGVTGPTVDLRLGVVDGAWQAVDATPTVSVRGTSDTAVLRFALGRTDADDPALTVDEGARPFKAWFPGP